MSLCPKVCVWNYYKLNSLLDSWLCKLPVSSRINFTCLHLFTTFINATRFSCIKLCLLIITSYRFNICRICRNLASIFSELISYHLFLSTIISTNRVSIFLSSHVNFLYCFPVLQFHSWHLLYFLYKFLVSSSQRAFCDNIVVKNIYYS